MSCCFVTIATVAQEGDLELEERNHICRINRIAQQYPLCATSPCYEIDPRFGRFLKLLGGLRDIGVAAWQVRSRRPEFRRRVAFERWHHGSVRAYFS
jgi:hypothetical protein